MQRNYFLESVCICVNLWLIYSLNNPTQQIFKYFSNSFSCFHHSIVVDRAVDHAGGEVGNARDAEYPHA